MAFPLQLRFCTGVSWGCRPVAKVKKKICLISTEEFQLKRCRNPHPCGLAPSPSYEGTEKSGQVVILWDSSDVLPLICPQKESVIYTDVLCTWRLTGVQWSRDSHSPPLPISTASLILTPISFHYLTNPGLLCFLCSLFHVTGAEWLLKMRGDEECEEGSFCLWSEPDSEWWKPHGLWKSPVQLSVYRAP